MHQVQELVRLHRLGRSGRQIARLLRMGRETVREYLATISQAKLLDGPADDLPSAELLGELVASVAAPAPPQQTSSIESWEPRIGELVARGAGPKAIHDALRTGDPDFAGSLSAVKRVCRRLGRERGPAAEDVAIPVETAPGEVAQVDFGYVGELYDPDQRILRRAWVFVMVLGFSRHMFADAVFDQRAATWLDLHARAFQRFGGVPRVIVPDNLKAAVVRAAFGVDDDAVLSRSYRELARHFGFQVDPAPPRSPKKKGKVEAGVRYVRHNFLATCDAADMPGTRRALRRWLDDVAAERVHGTTGRRPRELFESVERDALLPIPARPWEPVEWRRARVHSDSHVQVDGALYSAPWPFLHRDLWVRCGPASVTVYHDDAALWTHPRVARGLRSTVAEHMPEHRRDLRERSRGHWEERAGRMGAEVRALVQSIFGADDVLLRLRRVQAVVTHLERFPAFRARAAAARALHFESTSFDAVKSILRKGLDLQPLPSVGPTRPWSSGSRFARTPGGTDDTIPIPLQKELAS